MSTRAKTDYRTTMARLRRVDPEAFAAICKLAEGYLSLHEHTLEPETVFQARLRSVLKAEVN